MENYNLIDPVILKNKNIYIRKIKKLLVRSFGREIYITAKDIFMITLQKVAEGKRKLKNTKNCEWEFYNMMRSVASNIIRIEKSHRCKEEILLNLFFTNSDPCSENMQEQIEKLWPWIIDNNQVELYFVLTGLMEGDTMVSISKEFNLPLWCVKYDKQIIKEFLEGKRE